MSVDDVVFIALAAAAVVTGWRVFRTDSMVRASFFLMSSFLAVGGIMLLLAAPYLGLATIFMMAVEMMVMALFMVMFMMNPAGLNPMSMVHQHRVAVGAGVVSFVGLAAFVLLATFPDLPVADGAPVIERLGTELLGDSMLVFESAGVTLLATMIGTVILSARSGRFGPSDEGSRPPGLSPGGEPAGTVPEEGGGHGHHHGHGGGHGHGDGHDDEDEDGHDHGHDHGGSS